MGIVNAANGKGAAPGSGAYVSANAAFYYPFTIKSAHTYTGMIWMNGSTVDGVGNVNGAVYSADGLTALGTIGSVLQAGTTATQQKAFPAPLALPPGTYYLAISLDSANHLLAQTTGALILRAAGVRQLAAAFALTASAAAWIGMAQSRVYYVGIYEAGWL